METWGSLPKSQVDNSTVDEEIDAKIATHEADVDAHLEVGESLQSHKAAEIIDHVVGSVLSDKLTMSEFLATTIFESLSGWAITGSVLNSDFPGCVCTVEYGVDNESSAYTTPQVPERFLDDTVDLLFQLMGRFVFSNTHFHAWFGYLRDSITGENLFGFQVRDGALYAQFDDTVYSYSLLITGVTLSNDNVFRVQYNATSRTITWYVNGGEVASYVVNVAATWNYDMGPAFGVKLSQSNDGNFHIGLITFSRQI